MRNYKSDDRSAQDERNVLIPDENELQQKQTIGGLQKGKCNLRSKPYSKNAKYVWKTI